MFTTTAGFGFLGYGFEGLLRLEVLVVLRMSHQDYFVKVGVYFEESFCEAITTQNFDVLILNR